MGGFFTDTELAEATPAGCGHTCQLNRGTNPVPVGGQGKRGVLLVFDSGAPKAMLLAYKALSALGIDPQRDCWKMGAVSCPCPRPPLQPEIAACRPNVLKAVRELQPKLIIMFGAAAMSSLVGHSAPKIAFGKKKGFPLLCDKVFPDQAFPGAWLACVMSPEQVERQKFDAVVETVWRKSLKLALEALGEPLPRLPNPEDCQLLTDPERAERLLSIVLEKKPLIAFDYETTGLKPHAKGHRVVSVGFCPSFTASYAFDVPYPVKGTAWEGVFENWRKIMADSAVPKVAHNAPYEWEWTRRCFRVVARGWVADTQVLSHLEDSRPGHSGLKAQSYLKFGAPEYAEETDRFKRASPEDVALYGCNALNKMDKAPSRARLKYNGIDALYTYWLFKWFQERGLVAPDGKSQMVYG